MTELKPIPQTSGSKTNVQPKHTPLAQVKAQPQPDEVKVPVGGVAQALRDGKTTFSGKDGSVEK